MSRSQPDHRVNSSGMVHVLLLGSLVGAGARSFHRLHRLPRLRRSETVVTPVLMARIDDFAHGPSTLNLGDLRVPRLGYGAMRLPGKDVWGEPPDRARAIAVLRRVVELGIRLIDTAWYYGPYVANTLIAEALYPYPKDLVIACKLGGRRTPDRGWVPFLRPEELREGLEHDLRTLKLERIDVVHLRLMPSAGVPFAEALDALIDEQRKGRIRHLALSTVDLKEMDFALGRTTIVAVQNLYNVGGGGGQLARLTQSEVEAPDAVLGRCEERGIAFSPSSLSRLATFRASSRTSSRWPRSWARLLRRSHSPGCSRARR
jgi:pyridoxine 4-dehydrogenase